MSERRAAGFVVFKKVDDDFKFLLLQHSSSTHHWTPPKGHNRPGESDLETAFRETEQESGLKKEDLRILDDFEKVVKYSARGKPKIVTYWLAELMNKDKPIVVSNVHEDCEWVSLTRGLEIAYYTSTKEVLTDCYKYLQGQKGTSKED